VNKRIFTVKEVAQLLGFSTNTVYKYLKEGRIKSTRLDDDGRFRIPQEEVSRLMQSQGKEIPVNGGNNGNDLVEALDKIKDGLVKEEKEDAFEFNLNLDQGDKIGPVPSVFDWLVIFLALFLSFSLVIFPVRVIKGGLSGQNYLWIQSLCLGTGGVIYFLSRIVSEKKKTLRFFASLILGNLFFIFGFYIWKIGCVVSSLVSFGAGLVMIVDLLIKPRESILFSILTNFLLLAIGGLMILNSEALRVNLLIENLGLGNRWSIAWLVLSAIYLLTSWEFELNSNFLLRFLARSLFAAMWLSLLIFILADGIDLSAAITAAILISFSLMASLKEESRRVLGPTRKVLRNFLLSSVFGLVGLFLVIFINHTLENYILKEVGERAQSGVAVIESFISLTKDRTIGFSQNQVLVEEMFLEKPVSEKINQVSRDFYLTTHKTIRRVLVIGKEGKVFSAYPYDSAFEALDLADRDYFQVVKSGQKHYLSGILVPKVPTVSKIIISSAPILKNEAEFLGAVALSIDLPQLANNLKNIKLFDRGRLMIFDQNHELIVSEEGLTGAGLAQKVKGSKTGPIQPTEMVTYDENGGYVFQAFRPVASLGWEIVFQQPATKGIFYLYMIISFVIFLGVMLGNLSILNQLDQLGKTK